MLPRPITHYTATNYPFIYVAAFEEVSFWGFLDCTVIFQALALAEVPKAGFLKLSYHFAEDRVPKTVGREILFYSRFALKY